MMISRFFRVEFGSKFCAFRQDEGGEEHREMFTGNGEWAHAK